MLSLKKIALKAVLQYQLLIETTGLRYDVIYMIHYNHIKSTLKRLRLPTRFYERPKSTIVDEWGFMPTVDWKTLLLG
jgi:hypothetical protein